MTARLYSLAGTDRAMVHVSVAGDKIRRPAIDAAAERRSGDDESIPRPVCLRDVPKRDAVPRRWWLPGPAAHGGAGSALVQAVLTWARGRGYERMGVCFHTMPPRSRPFGLGYGFVPPMHAYQRRIDARIARATPGDS